MRIGAIHAIGRDFARTLLTCRKAVLLAAAFVAHAGCRDGQASAQAQASTSAQEPAHAQTASDSTLTRLLNEILPAVELASGIAAVRPLQVARADSARLLTYVQEQLESQLPPATARAVTATYARLGLVPDTLDLRGLLEALLREQVVGYYDPASDTLFVLEHVPPAQLEVVLAHELVHALQDQRVDLDSLRREIIDANDRTLAAQAAIEGHATFAMMEWQLGQMSGGTVDLTQLPDLGAQLANLDLEALGDVASVAVLRSAPQVIQEELIFPYVGGLVFLQRAWSTRDGRPLPFGDGLPRSTEQVLHLDRYIDGDHPTEVVFSRPAPPGWEEVYANGLGELETRVFLAQHLGDDALGETAAGGWDGDAYRLLRGPEGEVLVWVSVWDADAEADEFAEAARAAYRARYGLEIGSSSPPESARQVRVERVSLGGRSGVVIQDVPRGTSPQLLEALARVELSEQ